MLAAAAGVAVAATSIGSAPAPGVTEPGMLPRTTPIAFRSFDDCTTLLGYYRSHATRLMTPYGLPGNGSMFPMAERATAAADSSVAGAVAAPAGTAGDAVDTASGSGTNVQVAGVDEADSVKRSGDLLLSVVDGRLRVAQLAAGRVRMIGSLAAADWQPSQLLVDGHTVLLVGASNVPVRALDDSAGDVQPDIARPGLMPFRPVPVTTRLAQVDLTDPTRPTLTRTLDVTGNPTGVRLVGGTARVVLSSDPVGPAVRTPQYPEPPLSGVDPGYQRKLERADQKALARNRAAVASTTIDDWLPQYTVTELRPDGSTVDTSRGRLLDCASVSAPEEFSGLTTVSLLNLDLRSPNGISTWFGASVVASGSTLYATADRAYLATSPWVDWSTLKPESMKRAVSRQHTQIHLFDTTDSTAPRYVGSGQVPGFLIGQFAMDEHDGRLRVASTEQPPFAVPMPVDGGPAVDVAPDTAVSSSVPSVTRPRPETSQSMVSVLEPHGNALDTVGVVTGLGRGETIRAVRFIGAVGYVVTFRQTDPLYTIDLSVPTRPRVSGDLKILGYSAYLHPVGDGRLVGLGQAADQNGATSGLQLSLFDVSDPANPRRVDRVTVRGAWSDGEGDHHAFGFTDGMALAPYSGYSEVADGAGGVPEQVFDAGVLAIRVQGDRFGKEFRLRPMADGPLVFGPQVDPSVNDAMSAVPLRTQVLDGYVYTVTPIGIAAHDATTMTRVGFTRF